MSDIVNAYVVPSIGLVTANLMFAAPMKLVVRQLVKLRRLETLNPLPYPVICGNCFAWMLYGTVLHDSFLYWSNFPGFLMGLFYMGMALSCTDLTPRQLKRLLVVLSLCLGLDNFVLYLSYLVFADNTSAQKSVAGANCIIQLVYFYLAPLSTLRHVLKTRDSSTIDPWLALVCLLNGLAWSVYGLYLQDWFLVGPNSVGATNGVLQLVCCCIFPRSMEKLALSRVSSTVALTSMGAKDGDDTLADSSLTDSDVGERRAPKNGALWAPRYNGGGGPSGGGGGGGAVDGADSFENGLRAPRKGAAVDDAEAALGATAMLALPTQRKRSIGEEEKRRC